MTINNINRLPQLSNGDFFILKKTRDENLIEIDFALRSDIDHLESIAYDFDIIFSKQINRIGTNYSPAKITNQTGPITVTYNELEDFCLCLAYEFNDSLGYTY